MQARLYTPEDYPLFVKWWQGHETRAVDKSVLSPLGVIMDDETGPLAGCWVYLALGCGLALGPAWLTTNPELSPLKAARVIRRLVSAAKAVVPEEYGLMVAVPKQASYARLLESEGFIANHPCTEMLLALQGRAITCLP